MAGVQLIKKKTHLLLLVSSTDAWSWTSELSSQTEKRHVKNLDRAGIYKKPEWRDYFPLTMFSKCLLTSLLSKLCFNSCMQKKEFHPKRTPAAAERPKQWCHKATGRTTAKKRLKFANEIGGWWSPSHIKLVMKELVWINQKVYRTQWFLNE